MTQQKKNYVLPIAMMFCAFCNDFIRNRTY